MTNEYKANLWNECLKQNIFSNCREDELPRIQELFEQTIEENKDLTTNDFIAVLGVKIKQISYKDLIPSKKQPIIDFSDNIEEEPLKDIDKLIAEKQKERQNDEPKIQTQLQNNVVPQLQNNVVQQLQNNVVPQLQNNVVPQLQNNVVPQVQNNDITEIRQMVRNQNMILEKILESQIKILRHLQKK